MNGKLIAKMLGNILFLEAAFMVPSAIFAAYDGDMAALRGFLFTIILLVVVSGVTRLLARTADKTFYAREGFLLVALTWFVASLFGALPFTISGEIPHYLDAFFETVSGFTTTGATILTRVEDLSRASLYWRSFTHWLGGMGILVFMLAVIPTSKDSGHSIHLLRAESAGPAVEKIVPRTRNHAMILYGIYIGMTVLCFLFLFVGGMPFFDSLCMTFGTAGTGGFGIRGDSMASYSLYSQVVVTIFMVLFGINFNLFFLILTKKIKDAFRDREFMVYMGIMVAAILIIVCNVYRQFENLGQALHHVAFSVSSVMTTTGYMTVDYNLWPELSRGIIMVLMMIGASAGSTGGGFKVARVMILVKMGVSELRKMLHPRSVNLVKVNGRVIGDGVLRGVHTYLFVYLSFILLSFLLISVDNFSLETNLTAVISCLNNIGPGLGMVGPVGNFSEYSHFSKLVLTIDMLLGRLEIFPVLILFQLRSWNRAT
jgi:trk system potassium uptake protein TrkH